MPRFYFNIHDGQDLRDKEGCELPDLQAARAEAVRYAGELLRHEKAENFWNHGEWRMDVTDEDGLILFILMFNAFDAPAVGSFGGRSGK